MWPLLCWSLFPLYTQCWVFSWKDAEFYQMPFLHLLRRSYDFYLSLVNVICHTGLLAGAAQPCIPEINPSWSWCTILLMYCWIWFANILLRSFASMFIRDTGLCYLPLSGFGIRIMLSLWLWVFSSPLLFWKFEKDWY